MNISHVQSQLLDTLHTVKSIAKARRLDPHDIEDVMQETCLRVLKAEKHGAIRQTQNIKPFVRQIAQREAINKIRSKCKKQCALRDVEGKEPPVWKSLYLQELLKITRNNISLLSPQEQQILNLKCRSNIPISELSKQLNQTRSALRAKLSRAKARLRKWILQDVSQNESADGLGPATIIY